MDGITREEGGKLSLARRIVGLHLTKLVHFAGVSGTGLILDFCLFLALLSFRLPPFAANFASSCAAVTFVYFASLRRVFRYGGEFHASMFALYAAYQAFGIAAGSWVIQLLIGLGAPGAVAKLAIVPVTFSANYLFMSWLTSNPARWSGEAQP
jgi:putative flippase GtrA